METVTTNARLRGLLRTARREAGLTQKQAAERTPGVKERWWKQVESAYETVVSVDTLLSMFETVRATPDHLDDIGENELAEALLARRMFREVRTSGELRLVDSESLEKYLMEAPASEEMRLELVAYVRARHAMKIGRLEPFTDQFVPE